MSEILAFFLVGLILCHYQSLKSRQNIFLGYVPKLFLSELFLGQGIFYHIWWASHHHWVSKALYHLTSIMPIHGPQFDVWTLVLAYKCTTAAFHIRSKVTRWILLSYSTKCSCNHHHGTLHKFQGISTYLCDLLLSQLKFSAADVNSRACKVVLLPLHRPLRHHGQWSYQGNLFI